MILYSDDEQTFYHDEDIEVYFNSKWRPGTLRAWNGIENKFIVYIPDFSNYYLIELERVRKDEF